MWWFYFDVPAERIVAQVRRAFRARLSGSFVWGYSHYLVFASAGVVGAGLIVAVERIIRHSHLSRLETGFAIVVPVTVYLVVVWVLHAPYKPPGPVRTFAVLVATALILLSVVTSEPVLITGLVMAALVGVSVAVSPDQREMTTG
jgi:low temperature requirement protein LtrA